MINYIKSLWNKRYLNSAERYARQEKIAKIAYFVALIGIMLALCLMMLFGV